MADQRDGLQIPTDERHQRHEWRLEVAGFMVIGLVLLAALAGLVGAGPASRAVAAQDGLRLEYNRFVRAQGPERLVVRLAPDLAEGGHVRVWISRSVIEAMELQHVDPAPLAVEVEGLRQVWVFSAPRGGADALTVSFRYVPDFVGRRQGRLGIDGGPEIAFWQFAFP